jgi:hypothetical protein
MQQKVLSSQISSQSCVARVQAMREYNSSMVSLIESTRAKVRDMLIKNQNPMDCSAAKVTKFHCNIVNLS